MTEKRPGPYRCRALTLLFSVRRSDERASVWSVLSWASRRGHVLDLVREKAHLASCDAMMRLRIPYRPGTLWECLCVSTCRGATVADMEWWLLAGGHDDSVWTVTLIVVLLRSYGFCVARSFSCPRTRIDLPFFLLVGDPILMNTRLVMARSCRRSAAL